ncbi:hypothetical protein PLESTF_000823600 [Pleodorina starrii]|nr:hypothetical protein PLESTM_000174700 [Pleodorina starrii]GLC69381.1 hypothetical protein PLESTF_000823600 [Pleodorina starrii]
MSARSAPAPESPSSGRWHLASIRVRGFKSFGPSWVTAPLPSANLVGILGPNGSGKSNLLEAVLFAVGCPATTLRVRTLRELASSDATNSPCEVELTLHKKTQSLPPPQQQQHSRGGRAGGGGGGGRGSRGAAAAAAAAAGPPLEMHVLRASLAPDGASRAFQLDGRARTAQQIKDFLTSLGMSLGMDSGSAAAVSPRVIRQTQVTALADGNDPAALAALVGSASGLVRWREETRRGREELDATRGSLREIRANLDRLQSAVRSDEERLAAASRLAFLELEVAAVGGELGTALERWVERIQADLDAHQSRERAVQGELQQLEASAAAAEAHHGQLVSELESLLAADAAAAAAPPASRGGFGAVAARRRRGQASAAAAAAASAAAAAGDVATADKRDGVASGGAAARAAAVSPAAVVAAVEQQLAVETEKVRLGERQMAEGRVLRDAAAAAARRQAAAAAELQMVSEAADREAAKLEEREGLLEEMTSAADAAAAAAQYEEHLAASAAESAAEASAARERLAAAEASVRRTEGLLAAAQEEAFRRENSGTGRGASCWGMLQTKAGAEWGPAGSGTAAGPAGPARSPGGAAAAAAAAADAAAAAADDDAAAVRSAHRELSQIRVRADALRRALQLPSPPAAAPTALQPPSHPQQRPPPAAAPYRRLYQCFTFRPGTPAAAAFDCGDGDGDDEDDGGWAVRPWPSYLHALSVIVGTNLQMVLVCDTAAAAARLAEDPRLAAAAPGYGHGGGGGGGGGKMRLWPLDRIRSTDMSAAQRRAQMELAAQGLQAWLPLDLLRSDDPRVGPALLRAFGRHMVAADDSAAAALATRFGLSSVTLAGSVSHRGVLTGGWDGGGGGGGGGSAAAGRQLLERLWELSELGRLEARLTARLVRQQAAAEAAEQRRAAAEAAALGAVALESGFRDVQRRIGDLQEQLAAAQHAQQAAAAATAAAEQEDAHNQRTLLSHRHGGGGGGAGGATDVRQGVREGLAAEVAALRARADELAAARGEAQRVAEAAEAEGEAAEARAAGVAPEAEAEARLEERRKLVQDLQRRLREATAAVEAAARRRQELEASVAAAADRTTGLQSELRRRRTALRAEQEEMASSRAALKRVVQERDAVRREYGRASASADACAGGGGGGGGGAAAGAEEQGCEAAAGALRSRLRSIRAERARLEGSQVPPAQLLQFQERVAAVGVLRERTSSLTTAADMLQAAIEQSADQVLAANTAVFHAVRRRFAALCARLLPSLDLDLTAPDGCASRGVAVRFRRRQRDRGGGGGDDGAAGGGGGWSEELGQLSGGQRTLVSVALLLGLALALGGGGGRGGGGGLFLLDEVDAALDEHNQAAVAALLRHLSHRGEGCQVLAVTHNAAFQAACEGFVRVTRGPAGTQVEAAGVAGGAGAARGGDADAGAGASAVRVTVGPGPCGAQTGPMSATSGDGDAAGRGARKGAAVLPVAKKARTAGQRRM